VSLTVSIGTVNDIVNLHGQRHRQSARSTL